MEDYIKQGIVALLPVYTAESRTIVVTLSAEHQEGRGVPWLLDRIAKYHYMDLSTLRDCCGALLGLQQLISLPISDKLIFLPFKVRQAQAAGESTIGLVNMTQIEDFGDYKGPGPWLAVITCKNDYKLYILNTTATIKARMLQGKAAALHCQQKQLLGHPGPDHKGLSRDAIIAQLPNCDCFLKEYFCQNLNLLDDRDD